MHIQALHIRFSIILLGTACMLCAVGLATPLAADTVYLTHGRTMQNATVELTETQIRIRIPGGEMRMALSEVVRIEESETPYGRYLDQLARLRRDPATSPAAWLGLARWAQLNELENEAKEAAVIAARMAPHLEGLAPMMRGLGFSFDEQTQSWLTQGEAMRRRGLVQHHGEWTTPGERAERIRAESAERREAELAAARRLEERQRIRQEEQLQRQVAPQRLEIAVTGSGPYPGVRYPGAFNYSVPGSFFVLRRPALGGHAHRPGHARLGPVTRGAPQRERSDPSPPVGLDILVRTPGSLIPIRSPY